jgi:hypothetical protein
MENFTWLGFIIGFICFPVSYSIYLVSRGICVYLSKKKWLTPRWIESYKETDKGIELISKKREKTALILSNSTYRFDSGIKFTIYGDALFMFFFKDDGTTGSGPFYVKLAVARILRGMLQQSKARYDFPLNPRYMY